MDTCNSHAKFGCQTQARQKINKITYQKLQQKLFLTLILSFFGTLIGNWNIKYIKNQINNLSIWIKEVLTLMQRSMQSQAACFTGSQNLPQERIKTLKWRYMKDTKDTPRPYQSPGWLRKYIQLWIKYALKLKKDAKREKRSGRKERSMFFCIGFYKIWREKIYNIIK